MRYAASCLTLAVAAALFAGCATHRDQRPREMAASPELMSRFEAASAITDLAMRDQALATVASLGAQIGDGRVTLNAIGAMSVSPARDQAAAQCSARLAKDGWVPVAVAVARLIGDPAIRDRAMSNIAQSSPYPAMPE